MTTKMIAAAALALSLIAAGAATADDALAGPQTSPVLTTKDAKAPVKWDVGDLRISIPGVF